VSDGDETVPKYRGAAARGPAVPAGGKEKGTGYFVEGFLGRPRGRNVDASPVVVATYCCHSAEPKG